MPVSLISAIRRRILIFLFHLPDDLFTISPFYLRALKISLDLLDFGNFSFYCAYKLAVCIFKIREQTALDNWIRTYYKHQHHCFLLCSLSHSTSLRCHKNYNVESGPKSIFLVDSNFTFVSAVFL